MARIIADALKKLNITSDPQIMTSGEIVDPSGNVESPVQTDQSEEIKKI